MAYFHRLWLDTRRVLFGSPDLLLIAVTAAVALTIPQYVHLRFLPRFPGVAGVVFRSVVYLALPLASLALLRLRPGQLGLAWGKSGRSLIDIGLLYALMVPLLVIAARQPAFRHTYPYFGFERHGLGLLCLGLGVRLFGMFAWEFLFRGYLLFGFERRIGPAAAIAVTTIPFVLMHFGKPLPEALGAAVAGVALGIVALRSRSFIPCAILHWSVAATLDLLALQAAVA
jgi:uncharacterized protein